MSIIAHVVIRVVKIAPTILLIPPKIPMLNSDVKISYNTVNNQPPKTDIKTKEAITEIIRLTVELFIPNVIIGNKSSDIGMHNANAAPSRKNLLMGLARRANMPFPYPKSAARNKSKIIATSQSKSIIKHLPLFGTNEESRSPRRKLCRVYSKRVRPN